MQSYSSSIYRRFLFHSAPFVAAALLCMSAASSLAQQTVFKETKESQQIRGTEDSGPDRRPFLGPIYPEDLSPALNARTMADKWLTRNRVSSYGWLDAGITHISHVSGQALEAPVPNRFIDQPTLNAVWLTVQRPLGKEWSWGFRTDFYAGSDAALLRPRENFGPQSARWGTDFRQAYLSFRTPILLPRGVEVEAGRINVPIGYETLMGPYRPIYSEGYFWIHYEVGSTAVLATLHPSERLAIVMGPVMGYNTVFTLRGRSPSYVGRLIYSPRGERARQWLATMYTGPQPVSAQAGHVGLWQTIAELQAREVWTPRLTQVAQVHYADNVRDPSVGGHNSHTAGAFVITSYKLSGKAYVHSRLEWFSDPSGMRIAQKGTYSEATLGLSLLPRASIDFRPEIRGDFASQRSFGDVSGTVRHRNQASFAFEILFKLKLLPQ